VRPGRAPARESEDAGQGHGLKLAHAFGVYPAAVRDSLVSVGDDAFAYLSGRHVAICDHVRHRVCFLPRDARNRVVTSMTKSMNGKYLAIAEREGGEDGKVQISIHSLPKPDLLLDGKVEAKDILHRVLHPANRRLDISGLAFTTDGKYLLSLSAMPESTVTYWRWEAEKAVSSHDIQLPVTRLQVNPKSSFQLSISGPNYLRLWEYNPNDNQLRDHPSMFPLKLEKQLNIVDHCWVLGAFLCAASEDGHVYLFEDGEQQQDVDVRAVIGKDEASGKVAVERAQAKLLQAALSGNGSREILEQPVRLVSLAAWGGGFVVGGDQGYMGVFKVDSKTQVEPFGTFRMPHQEGTVWQMSAGSEDTCLAILSYTEREAEDEGGQMINVSSLGKHRSTQAHLRLSRPSTGGAGITAEKEKEPERMWSLSTFPVGQADLAATGQLEVFAPVHALGSHSNHHGPVSGMGVAQCRRIVVTCGTDQQLKVWGYPTEEMLDQPSPFSAELGLQVSPDGKPKAVAVHPLGFQVAVVTNDLLRIFHLTARQATRTLFDLPLKHPGDVAYSNGGNLLAVTTENDVILVDPWRSVLVHMFSGRGGHLSAVNQVLFSEDDRLLLSCGAAPHGAIYGWDLESETKERALEHVSKGTNYASIVHDFRRQLVVACIRPEGSLRVVSGKETTSWRDIKPDSGAAGYTCMCLASPLGMFFAGTQLGSVRVFTWPFPDGEPIRPFTDVALHAHSINTLSLSVNAHLLFSACQGGTVMASHVRPERPDGNRLVSGHLAQRFVHYRFREDGGSHRNMNREDERKIHDLPRKLTEAGQGFSNQAATMDELLLLPKAYFQECLHEIKELEERANSLEHESEYTLEQKEHEIQDKLQIIYNERKAERQRSEEKYDAMFQQFKRANARHQEELKLANSNFDTRIREREGNFDSSISKEYDKQSRLLDELQSLRETHATDKRQLEAQHEEHLESLRAMQEKTIKEWKGRHDQLCSLLKSDGLKFEEALRQQEQEYEQQITEMLEHKRIALQVESDKSTMALKDGVSMKQTINMLQRQLEEKNKELEEAKKREEGSYKKEAATKEMLAQVKEQLKERERGLKIKDESLAKMREQMKHLESFRFVLFHKVRALEEERDPLEEQVNSLKSSVREMYGEFVREFRDKQALGRQLQDKSQLSGALQNENSKLVGSLSQLRKEGQRLLQDLEKVLHSETTADFEKMPQKLQEVLTKYSKLKDWKAPAEETPEASAQDKADAGRESKLIEEMVIQRDLLYRKNQIAVQSEGQTKRGCSQEVRRLTSENAQLIVEMNTLRNENRSWQRSCKELEASVMALKAKQAAANREASSKGLRHVESAPELDPAAGPPRAVRRAAPKAAGAETPYLRRKIIDQQELYRKQRQKQLSSLPPVNVPDGSEGYPAAGRQPRSQDARFAQSLGKQDPSRWQVEVDSSTTALEEDFVPSGVAEEM
jgi:WD40 repeat protein